MMSQTISWKPLETHFESNPRGTGPRLELHRFDRNVTSDRNVQSPVTVKRPVTGGTDSGRFNVKIYNACISATLLQWVSR